MNTDMFSHMADISLGRISHSIYISVYKCCIYKTDTRLILADCDLQQQQRLVVYTQNSSGIKCTPLSGRFGQIGYNYKLQDSAKMCAQY